ncbi:MAG: hypothetical protein IT167_23195 [Bryobacterales bacterium]|nr:hypothetical protein [Bryobacterales bacterium]
MHLQDGYKLIRAEQLAGAVAAFSKRKISFRSFRAYVACLELLAIREAADRSATVRGRNRQRLFRRAEVEALLRLPEGMSVSRELSSLTKAELLRFSDTGIELGTGTLENFDLASLIGSRGGKRLIPVPRQVLRFLASCTRPALAKTIVAYLLRGLSLDRSGQMRSAGTVKISWICKTCRISERAARSARAALIQLGWITKDTGSFQRKLNRDGAYFVINASWRRVANQSAPREPEKCTQSAPPREKQETPYGSKNQKSAFAASGVRTERSRPATLRDIQPEDLKKPERLEKLYREAVSAGWIEHSEASVRNFVCAALRATRTGGRVGAIFVGIVRKRLWHHISHEQEDRALAVLRQYQSQHLGGFAPGAGRTLSDFDPVQSLVSTALEKSHQATLDRTLKTEAERRRELQRQANVTFRR